VKTPAIQLELPFVAATSAPHPTFRAVVPGQAHFSGTGPSGLTCRQCLHWTHGRYDYSTDGYLQPARCGKFKELTNSRGAKVSPDAPACKYFAPTDLVPAPFISPHKLKIPQLKRGFQPCK
jgi:hypothetical protein